jgi:hypothetical protein
VVNLLNKFCHRTTKTQILPILTCLYLDIKTSFYGIESNIFFVYDS